MGHNRAKHVKHMKLTRLLTVALWCVIATGQATAMAQCKPPSLTVTSKYTQPWIDYTDIRTLNPQSSSKSTEIRMGETVSLLNTKIDYKKMFNRSQGCFSIDGEVQLEMKSHDINIAKELRPLPCLLKEVYDHEQRHALLNEEMLKTLEQQVQNRVNEVIAAGTGYTPRQLGLYLESWLQDGLSKDVTILWSRQNERQKELDTPQEYRRISAACPAETQALAIELKKIDYAK